MRVDRCICHHHTFAQLRAIVDRSGADLAALQEETRCSTGCGMCLPYLLLMLETGGTSFPLLSDAAAKRIVARHKMGEAAGDTAAP